VSWALLGLAIAADTAAVVLLERSHGLRRRRVAAVAAGMALVALWAFARSLEDIPTSVADAIFASVGTASVAIVGTVALGQPLRPRAVIGMAFIAAGVVGLCVAGSGG